MPFDDLPPHKPFDTSIRTLVSLNPLAFAKLALGDQANQIQSVEAADTNVSTAVGEVDGVLIVELRTGVRFVQHLEALSTPMEDQPHRMMLDNTLLQRREKLVAVTTLLLLRQEADAPRFREPYVQEAPVGLVGGLPFNLAYCFHTIRLWEIPAAMLADGELALSPLSVLGQADVADLPARVQRVIHRIDVEAPSVVAREALQASMFLLLGLRCDWSDVRTLIGDRIMHALEASSTYQWLLNRGRQEGLEQGREQGLEQGQRQTLRATIIDLGKLRLGAPPQEVLDRLNAIDDNHLLQQLVLKSPTATSWDQLAPQAI